MLRIEQLYDVVGVEVSGEYRMRLTFDDGTVGEIDFAGSEWRGVFEPLQDPEYFARVMVDADAGTVTRPNRRRHGARAPLREGPRERVSRRWRPALTDRLGSGCATASRRAANVADKKWTQASQD